MPSELPTQTFRNRGEKGEGGRGEDQKEKNTQ